MSNLPHRSAQEARAGSSLSWETACLRTGDASHSRSLVIENRPFHMKIHRELTISHCTDRGSGTEPIGEASAPIDVRVRDRSVQPALYRSAHPHSRSVVASSQIGLAPTVDFRLVLVSSQVSKTRSIRAGSGTEPIGEASAPIDVRVCDRSVQPALYRSAHPHSRSVEQARRSVAAKRSISCDAVGLPTDPPS